MDNSTERSLGRIEGKLDGLGEALKTHMEQDTRRFETVFKTLGDHAEDINKAKGAQRALIWAAGGVASAVSIIAGAAQYILK